MSIQILGFREYTDKFGAVKKAERFFDKKWRAPSVQHLLENIDHYINLIPENERYNIFFTLADCQEKVGRFTDFQEVIAFDIDDICVERLDEYTEPILEAIGVTKDKVTVSFTGHGIHVYIMLDTPIDNEEWFKEHKEYYKAICSLINEKLKENFLDGYADEMMGTPRKMGRLPLTDNKKKDEPTERVRLLVNNLQPQHYDITTKAVKIKVEPTKQISKTALARLPEPDTKGVQECVFLKWCKNNQEKVDEPKWYAMLSIISRLKGGKDMAHEYSKEHPTYTPQETDNKIEQALLSSGPRTCEAIAELGDWCCSCEHFNKVKSPILIKSEDFIKTETTGFYNIKIDANGVPKIGKPNFADILKAFNRDYKYVTMGETRIVYVYTGTHYKMMPEAYINSYAQEKFKPEPTASMRREFLSAVHCTNLRDNEWINVEGFINFKNGVLDLKTKELLQHDPKYGFQYVLDYPYDPDAKCPRFDQFMDEITCNDADLKKILLEFGGYSFSNIDPAWGEKALILVGEGSNGKSVFLDVLKNLASMENYSALTLSELQDSQNRVQLMGKLFNLAEETPHKGMLDSSLFKNLVTGGDTTVKLLYKQPFKIKNTCKIMFACNELPDTYDKTLGLFRRLLIVPFNATFTGDKIDRDIRKKLNAELAGIFNRMIEGYDRLIEQQRFTDSDESERVTAEYAEEVDPINMWWNQHLIEDSDSEVPNKVLYESFKIFLEENGIRQISNVSFGRRLRAHVPKDSFVVKKEGGKSSRCLKGYKLIGFTNGSF